MRKTTIIALYKALIRAFKYRCRYVPTEEWEDRYYDLVILQFFDIVKYIRENSVDVKKYTEIV